MQKEIVLCGKKLRYDLLRKKVKNINLRIKANGEITVSAPRAVPLAVIENFLAEKEDFILRALSRFEKMKETAPKPKRYVSGEIFRVFGEEKTMLLQKGKKNTVTLLEDQLLLTVKDTDDIILKEKTVKKWQEEICREKILFLCEKIYPAFAAHGIAFPEIRFRRMTSRFGSCQPEKGVLTFNTALAEAPISCIEYVIFHEFCHFLHTDHSKSFYQELAIHVPDYKEKRRILNECVRIAKD